MPQPVGRAAERLDGPGVALTQLSGAPAVGGSRGGSSANSAGSAGRGLAPTPALLQRAQAAVPAPRLRRPRRRDRGFSGWAPTASGRFLSVGRCLWSAREMRQPPKLISSGAFVNFI